MKLLPGSILGSYEVIGHLGSGGMGEVYRALDLRLGREVAVKLLPESVAGSPEHLARFEREARLLAALSHPHVASIFGFEESSGRRFLVLELIPGETLAERLAGGPLPVEEALRMAEQIAAALEAAHAHAIVHRDLKPLNIKVRPDGTLKVLDFGLAKALGGGAESSVSASLARTTSLKATLAGVILGTPQYMSPEQARGQAVDAKTDLWSFGCVLYEMLTGRSPFSAPTFSDTLAGVLTREPDWRALPAMTPARIREALEACLRKEALLRHVDAKALRVLIEETRRELAEGEAHGAPGRGARPQPHLRQVTYSDAIEGFPAWSRDGKEILFSRDVSGIRKLFKITLSDGAETQLTHGDFDEIMPAWSPDRTTVLFTRARESGRKLEPGDVFAEYADADIWALELGSGRETRLVEQAAAPAFSPDGRRIAFDARWAGPRRIWTADTSGRNPQQTTSDTSEAIVHLRPQWSPDGAMLVFQSVERTKFNLRVVNLASREMSWITDDPYQDLNPVWSPSGRWIYFSSYRSGGLNIWRMPVKRDGAPNGAPEQVTTGAGQDVEIAMSPQGPRLAFTTLRQNADIWRLPVSPDTGRPTGAAETVIVSSREESRGAWSPDGLAIAFNSDRGGPMNIWLRRAGDSSVAQLTRGEGGDYQPNWSPDGRTLAFFSSRGGSPGIWLVDIPSGSLRRLGEGTGMDINPFHSPDGRLIAFQSDRSGRLELWVMSSEGREARQLTHMGVAGHFMRWTKDGAAVIFRAAAGAGPGAGAGVIMISVDGGDAVPLGEIAGGAHLSLSPDGTRIMDVVAHKSLWVSTIGSQSPEKIFEFDDPDARIDYPVWSPDGRWILFDRFRPQGGDVWAMENLE